AGFLERLPAFPVDVRPVARRFSGRDLDREPVVVQALDQAVDPAETQRLAHDILVRHRVDAAALFVPDQPDAGARRVILLEPTAPLFARPDVDECERFRHRWSGLHLAPSGASAAREPRSSPALTEPVPQFERWLKVHGIRLG